MKRQLLLTTALVAVMSASNVHAQAWVGEPDTDLVINEEHTISDSDLYYYKTIQVSEGGTLNLSNSNIKTAPKTSSNNDIVIKGELNLSNESILEAGTDVEEFSNNSNMLLDGATVNINNSDLEANGNITIKDTTLTSISTIPEGYGIWADGDITLEGGNTTLSNSYIAANGDIVFNGGKYSFSDSDISSENGNITIKDGNFNGAGFLAQNGDVNIEGGYIKDTDTVKEPSFEQGIKNLNIKGGTLDLENTFADNAQNVNITGGTVNMSNSEMAVWDGSLNISGGEINLQGEEGEESALYARKELNITGGTINMSGDKTVIDNVADYNPDKYDAYDLNISGGTINVTGKTAEISSSKNINITGGTINIASGSQLNMFGENENVPTTVQLGENGTFNISGTLNTSVNGNGTINVLSDKANIKGNVNLTGGVMGLSGNLTITDNFNMADGTVSIEGSDAKFNNLLAQSSQIEGGTININRGHLGVEEMLNISSGEINMNVGEIDAEMVNISGGKINMIGETGLSGSIIAISGGEITQQGTQQDRSGLWGTTTIAEDAIVNMKGYASIDENSTLSISDGTINVSGTDNVFGSVNDVMIYEGELNIAQGADLSLHKLASIEPDAAYTKGQIYMDEGQINLGGTINGDITGSDKGKIYFESSAAKIDGNVEGASLIFENSHTLSDAITGEIGGLDIFEIQKGTLVYDKNIESGASSVVVDSGATLDIGTNGLHSGGEKEVEGEGVFFKDNSTLKFALTDKDTYGKIYANYVNISENGTTLNLSLNGAALSEGDNPLIIKLFNGEDLAEAEIEGKFANLTTNSRYDFTDNEDGTYTVTSNGTTASDIVSGAGGTSSNASTAEAWDSVSAADSTPVAAAVTEKLAELSNSTDAATQKAYVDALTAVAPEVAPMVQHTQTETANQVFGAVGTRLSGGSISTGGEGMASGDNIFERAAMWVQGLFNKSKLDDTSKAYGFDADSNGVAMGFEKYVTDNTKLGVGYAYTNTDIDGFMRSTDVDTHTAIVYGEYKPSNWYVNGIASYGWSDYEEHKNVSGIGVKADYDVESFGLQAMTGYDMQVKGIGLTPEVGLRYVHISQDGYTDSAAQKVSGNDSDILTGVIGAKVAKAWHLSNGMMIKPEARIAATYDLMNDDANSVVTLANGSAYMVEGDALDRFGMEFGAGITAEVNDNIELSLGYEGKFRDDYQDHTGLLNAKYKF